MSKRWTVRPSAFSEIFTRHREGQSESSLAAEASVKAVRNSPDRDFVKLTCYIRKETHLHAKRKLLDHGGGQLSDWSKNSSRPGSKNKVESSVVTSEAAKRSSFSKSTDGGRC
jgi:hypothetical protein